MYPYTSWTQDTLECIKLDWVLNVDEGKICFHVLGNHGMCLVYNWHEKPKNI
jgi:hypothetical protein